MGGIGWFLMGSVTLGALMTGGGLLAQARGAARAGKSEHTLRERELS
jgi:hypothetical protein